jgi:hypothetical protein
LSRAWSKTQSTYSLYRPPAPREPPCETRIPLKSCMDRNPLNAGPVPFLTWYGGIARHHGLEGQPPVAEPAALGAGVLPDRRPLVRLLHRRRRRRPPPAARAGVVRHADGSPNFGAPPAAGATQNLPSGDPGSTQYWINDDGRASGTGSVAYGGSWLSGAGCGTQCFWSDDHWTGTAGDTATVTFTGTQIALLSVRDTNYGLAALSVDGGPETTVDLYADNRAGEQVTYLSPRLPAGTHTLRIRNTRQRNAASSGTLIEVDRAEVYG